MCSFRKSRTPKYARCSNGVAVEATNRIYCLAPHLFSQSLTAQRIFAIKTRRVKNQAAVSQDYLLGEGVLRTQADKRTLIRSVLINGMCLFADGIRAATAARKRAPSLTESTSDCAVWVRSWRTKRSDISREMPLSMREPSVAPREADAVGSLKFMKRGNGGGGNT